MENLFDNSEFTKEQIDEEVIKLKGDINYVKETYSDMILDAQILFDNITNIFKHFNHSVTPEDVLDIDLSKSDLSGANIPTSLEGLPREF